MNRLTDKVAIITGAAGGIGKATAQLFAGEGARVLATDCQEGKLKEWVEEAAAAGLAISWHLHDVTSESDWRAVVDQAIALFGRLDILVNNAGIYPPGATTISTTREQWNHVLDVNLTGPFLGSKAAFPFLRDAGGGSIVNVSSVAGLVGGNGPAYTSSKGALRLLTKDQAIEWAKYHVRVNAVHPGGVLTPMTEFMADNPASAEMIAGICPLARLGQPMEIAYGILYLASDESTYTTGSELVIDGGMVAR